MCYCWESGGWWNNREKTDKIGHILSLDHSYDEYIHALYKVLLWTDIMVQYQGWLFKSNPEVAYQIYEKV